MNFLCYDTEDNSKDLGAAIRAGKKGVSMFDKKVTQIAAMTAEGKTFYNKGDVKQFIKWLQQQPEKFIYALNMQYDLGNLFANELDELDCTLVGSRMIKAVMGDKIFADVFNIWFQGVESLGKVFGLRKLQTESMAEDKEYVFRDVEIIHKAMLFVWEFAASLGLEEVPATLGGLGVNLWKHWGAQTIHDSQQISRNARFGGRVELFKTHNATSTVGYTDINSLYPYVMTKEFPAELENTGTKLKRLGVARVTMEVPEMEICPLPFRDDKGRIIYGYGTFIGTWTISEINNAVAAGAKIIKVHEAIGTDEGVWPYKTYMERIYKIRLESKNGAEKELYKRLMNCLFGRTGTSGEIGRTVRLTERTIDKGIAFGKRVLVKYKMPLGDEVNWCHCSHITSYGRIELFKYLQTVGAERLIYCDTDSVIFDCPEKKFPFHTGKELGEMKIERCCTSCKAPFNNSQEDSCCENPQASDWWTNIRAYAPKMYNLGSKYKAKGVPKRLQKQFIETGTAEYDLPYKFREAVSFFDRGNSKRLSVWHPVEKHIASNYDKKILRGNRFFPCEV
jgi:hypothetical protein